MSESGTTKEPKAYKAFFKHHGKEYSLVKRKQNRDASWWLRAEIGGRKIMRSLDTNHVDTAEDRAIVKYIDPARSGDLATVDANRLRDNYAKLSALFACYRDLCVGKLPDKTVNQNIQGMRIVVRRGKGNDGLSDAKVDELSSSVLEDGELVASFEDWMARNAVATGRDLESNRRTVEAYLRHARSIFKETVLPRYKVKGVYLPDVTQFMNRAVEEASKPEREQPDDELKRVTEDAIAKLRATDRPVYMAFLLGLSSLRRGEISKMKWEYLKMVNGRPCVVLPPDRGAVKVTKNRKGRTVPLDPWVAMELAGYKKERLQGFDVDDEQYVLPSPRQGGQAGPDAKLRCARIFKRANAVMRAAGWKTNKTLHALRALALTRICETHGPRAAQGVAGHSDFRTTQDGYVGLPNVKDVTVTLPLEIADVVGGEQAVSTNDEFAALVKKQ